MRILTIFILIVILIRSLSWPKKIDRKRIEKAIRGYVLCFQQVEAVMDKEMEFEEIKEFYQLPIANAKTNMFKMRFGELEGFFSNTIEMRQCFISGSEEIMHFKELIEEEHGIEVDEQSDLYLTFMKCRKKVRDICYDKGEKITS